MSVLIRGASSFRSTLDIIVASFERSMQDTFWEGILFILPKCSSVCVTIFVSQILRTHHVCNTLSPCWERGVEVFVSDVTQVCTY